MFGGIHIDTCCYDLYVQTDLSIRHRRQPSATETPEIISTLFKFLEETRDEGESRAQRNSAQLQRLYWHPACERLYNRSV